MSTITGTTANDTLTGTAGNDSLEGLEGNDTLIGGAGDDTVNGGSGYNTYRVTGSADAFYWSVNAAGQMILTDAVTDAADPVDGSNEGVDNLSNIQVIEYVRPDGTVESTFQVDDYSNAPDASNYKIQYGVWVTGRANFWGDLDYFKLETVAGQTVVASMAGGSNWGYLPQHGDQYRFDGIWADINPWDDKFFTWTTSDIKDIYFRSEGLSQTSPMASKGYGFILRRVLTGTDSADNLTAGADYERLVGGLSNDTLTGSDRSDVLLGGDGNDLMTGSKGNDEIDGGAGTANVAVFSGNKADYTVSWTGGELNMRLSDSVAGRDGIDQLRNVQILRFVDGDVVLDAESNAPTSIGAVSIGQAMFGSLPATYPHHADVDYFQQKFTADINTNTALRISIQGGNNTASSGNIYFQFFAQGSSDVLTFKDLSNNSSINQFQAWIGSGTQQSWIVNPQYWGSNSEFLSTAQRADVRVWGAANGSTLGDLAGYSIRVDRVLYGTTGADTLVGDGLAGYVDARDGNDSVTGSTIDEEIRGGTGDDSVDGGAGNDIIRDGQGVNILRGGDGDDLIDVSGMSEQAAMYTTSPTASVNGGSGVDTLKVASDTNWAGLTVTNVEVLDGSGGRTSLTPAQLIAKGFTTAQNITFRLDPNLSTSGSMDGSALSGNFDLRGTNQSDTLIGNSADNTIFLGSDENVGAGLAKDTVSAGAGDDTIVWGTHAYQQWSQFFTSADVNNRTYKLESDIDGGDGTDELVLHFDNSGQDNKWSNDYWYHAWSETYGQSQTWEQRTSPTWKLDLSGLTLRSIERLDVLGYDPNRFWAYPSEFILSITQINGLSNSSGLRAVSVMGGGALDLAHLASIGIISWRFGDALAYTVTGSANTDQLTVGNGQVAANLGAGNDELVIDGKPLVTDVLDGSAGSDTLTIRGTDVDLSGATISNIEAIKVSSQSLSMTDAQWQSLGGIVSRVSGANTGYILSVTAPGTTTLSADSPYVGLTGSSGDDVLIGNADDNILVGGEGSDALNGNAGNDRLVTGAGVDTLTGGDGNDTLVVTGKTAVRDALSGGAGIDLLQVSDGQDLTAASISGIEVLKGSGTVTMSASQLDAFSVLDGVTAQLTGDSPEFILNSTTKLTNFARILLPQADTTVLATVGIVGSKRDDNISGNELANVINGGNGSDEISGREGPDTLIGGSGFDNLIGGTGDDWFIVNQEEFSNVSLREAYVLDDDGKSQYLGWANRVIHSDKVDGGSGTDTLFVNFGYFDSSEYIINSGLLNSIEHLVVKMTNGGQAGRVGLSADVFMSFSSISATHESTSGRHTYFSFDIAGSGQDINLDSFTEDSKIREIQFRGEFGNIDTSRVTIGPGPSGQGWEDFNSNHITVWYLDNITLSSGSDGLIINGDTRFAAQAGDGDDIVKVNSSNMLTANLDGGAGNDTLDFSEAYFLDISASSISNFETIRYGNSTLVVSQAQLDSLSFDGSGAKYTKFGNTIVGTTGNDSYNGDGTGSFQGGKGNDSINNVNTAVFTGNYADYDFVRNGGTLTVQQARGSMNDGTDNVSGVLNLQFADTPTPLKIDDNPDNAWSFTSSANWDTLLHADYGKRMSAKKNFDSDTDVFSATLAPNSPLAIEGSALNGSGWSYAFYDVATRGQIYFRSLVYGGWEPDRYYSWMDSSQKWLPILNGAPYEGGEVVIQAQIDGGIQDYAFTLNYLDDYAGSIDTQGQMNAQTGVIKGYIGDVADADWIRTDLIAGTKYEFHLSGVSSEGGSLVDPKLQLRDAAGRLLESGIDLAVNSVGNDDSLVFRPTESGSYYLAVTDVAGINKGSWTLTQQSLDTIAGNVTTTERIEWSGAETFTLNSEINALTDHDWFKVWLDNGITYNFRALGSSNGGTLADPQVSIRSATGILLAQDDNSGGGTDAKLVYSAPDSGWYFLDVGAAGNAYKGTYILSGATLADDFSNDLFTTGLVQAGTPLQGLVSYINDSDWVKVGLSKGVTYFIDLAGDLSDTAQLDPLVDPLLTIRDANGNFIARFDDFGGTLNSRAYFTPAADGLYYLEAKSAFKYDIGAWKLSVTQAPPDDFGSAMDSTAAALTLGAAKTGEIGIPGDRDVFKVSLEAGKVYQVGVDGLAGHAGTLTDPHLRIFDSAGHLLDFDNNGGAGNDARMYFAPNTTGTYYIEASSNHDRGMGTFQVEVVQRDLPADDVPYNLNTRVFLNPGDSFQGNLLTHNDQDWFGIHLTGGKDYVFRLQGSHSGNGSLKDPVLDIRAADGTLLKSVDNLLMSNEPAMLFTPTGDGTHYLVVKAADGQTDTGTYTLVSRAPDDFSNTKQGATTIALDQTLAGGIQYSDGAFGVRAYDSVGLASDIDEDWFKFDAAANQVLSVKVEIATGSALSRPMVEIVNGQGRSMAIGDGLETNNGLAVGTFKAPAAGTYYARVIDGAGATGAYTVTLATGDASDEDSSSAVSLDFANMGSIVQAESTAKIGLAGDTDTFTVALQQGHSYRIETLPVRDGTQAPLPSAHLSLSWQGEALEVAGDTASPSFFDSTVFTASASGALSINVAPLEETQTGQYKLRVIDLGTTQVDDRPDEVADYGAGGIWAINENAQGRIDSAHDIDLFSINLSAGNLYDFSIKSYADGLGTLAQSDLRLLDIDGQLVTVGNFDTTTGRTQLPVSVFEDGRYFLAVSAADLVGNTGTYVLDTRLRGSDESFDDISADTRSGVRAAPGQPGTGTINYSTDHDWIKTTLEAGKVYVLDVLADGDGTGGTLKDATLRLLNAQGRELAFDDNSGAAQDAHIQFTATASGDHYLDVGSNGETGTYTMRVRELYSGEADPLKSAQWYLDATEVDLLNGQITGAGVTVGIVDDGIDTSHPDLQKQLNFALAYDTQFNTQDGTPKYPVLIGLPPDNHGTAIAGIIAAEANNETGIVGVAQDADLVSTRVKWTYDQITEALGLQWQFDVSNNSWGAIAPFSDNFNSTALTFAWQALRTGVEDGRDGLGTVFVFSAGNGASNGENTNYHNFQNAREVIAVGAANSDGSIAGFSTPGANVLVSSYGVGLLTTDRHQPGWGYNAAGNYTDFSGTSAAAPMVSGVVALMLEANPNLGYRDVQEILAYSTFHPDVQDWKANGATNFNLGGLQFNDQAGFGLVDAYAAVRLAETWTDVSTAVNEVSASARKFGLTDAIPDGDGTVYTRSFDIDAGISVEHVELGVDLRHTRLGDLIIELTSPSGTVSTLMNRPTVNAEQPFGLSGVDSGVPTHLLWDFSSVQFWGEDASGTWTVTVKDVRAEETGTLSSLSLRVFGERDDGNDTYVFTDEGFQSAVVGTLSDETGIDTVNLSTLLNDVYVNLGSEHLMASQGVTYQIADWTVIENAYTGRANDRLDGNDAANLLDTYDGNDTLTGGLGNDTLQGGAGSDTAIFSGNRADYGISWNPNERVLTVVDNKSTEGDEGSDHLSGIERLVFADGEMSLSDTVGNRAPIANTTFFDQTIVVAPGMGIDFDLPDDAFSDPDNNAGNKGVPPGILIAEANGAELPDWLSFDPVTRKLTGVPPTDFRGQLKLKVKAVDEFGEEASDDLVLQFGDNRAPILDAAREWVVSEDAGTLSLGITAPADPEGKAVSVTILELPTIGQIVDKSGAVLAIGSTLSADALSEVHYQTAPDANGAAGYLRFRATDEDGVVSESSVKIFVDAVNDAPRFATASSKVVVNHTQQADVPLDMLLPSDPESTLTQVRVIELPSLGSVSLNGSAVKVNDWVSLAQLQQLRFSLAERVNGPIGAVTIQALDPQGAATNWSLNLEIQGDVTYSSGTAGADALYGSIGKDTIYGLAGDDTLVGNAGDDRLLAGLGNDQLVGGSGNDALDGSSGNDGLDGGTGSDTMSGGPGNDTYWVDSNTDVLLEVVSGGSGGKDLVITQVSLTAPANVESLQAADGAVSLNLTGNELPNVLMGNEGANSLAGGSDRDTLLGAAGNDSLDGGSGVDRMAGGVGNDTYWVDSRNDSVVELANEGVDTVHANTSFTLPSNVENLVLAEGGNYTAGGNSLDNRLVGNSGDNLLAGGLGRDTLEGGLGDDIYVVNDLLDSIIDTGGTDTLRSTLDVTLAADLENIELVGIGDTTATGNSANNRIVGNQGDNILDGGLGTDSLTGGAGSDVFMVGPNGSGEPVDQFLDFTPGTDLIVIDLAALGIDVVSLGLASSGTVSSSAFVKGPGVQALDPNDHFLFDTAQGLLKFDLDGNGATPAIELAKLFGPQVNDLTGNDLYVGV